MKPLTLLVLALLVAPSVRASPNGEEFVIEDIQEIGDIQEITTTTKRKDIEQPRAPRLPPRGPVTAQPSLSNKLIQLAQGAASWYGPGFYGRKTASAERLRKGTLTAAHRTLPFGTQVRVTNLNNGRSVVVRINDRGPFRYHRVIDLAHGAAQELQMIKAGEVPVQLEILNRERKTN